MTVRVPGGGVWGQGVQPSVMTMMASGAVSAAVVMPLAMLVPPAPVRVMWLVLCMCWSCPESSFLLSSGRVRFECSVL